MKKVRGMKRIRLTALIMTAMMLFSMLFSSFFIGAHGVHSCTGEDCPICACIQQCENTIRGLGSGISFVSAVILPAFLLSLFISFVVPSFKQDTPVSTKVRLNN
ncbi:MAG: hypothetical protein K6E91_07475 [Butyrivibrio sp.]|nr:hypothetical protein [Butyrivibrio sp.]